MTAPAWPTAGMLVDVRVSETGRQLRAVVDDVRPPDQLHLRAPVTLAGSPVEPLELGASLLLGWGDAASRGELPVVLADVPPLRAPVWRLTPASATVVEQRRASLRAPAFLRVELRRGPDRWQAGLCDLSAGGARCLVGAADDLRAGDRLHLRFDLDEQPVLLAAELLAVEPLDDQRGGRATLRLRFATDDAAVAQLRERVRDHARMGLAVGRR
jgi:hypothetical protein